MISISRLLCDNIGPGDDLRYRPGRPEHRSAKDSVTPIVVWNCTRRCNLKCIHCYANAGNGVHSDAIGTEKAKAFIDSLADFGVPVLLFSGGEPLARRDLLDLAAYARERGLRVVLSTNGTLMTDAIADRISEIGFAEVGISLDGIGERNDFFRGQRGAFDSALRAIRRGIARKQRISLRLTITRHNYHDLPAILQLVEDEGIQRVCFYHLAYSGRADKLREEDLDHAQTRGTLDLIMERTQDFYRRGLPKEILTVASHTDGVYLYLKLKQSDPAKAEKVYALLKGNGGNNSGIRIADVDDEGNVHPDQFWWGQTVGNVLERPFGDIWMDAPSPLLVQLRKRKELLTGRCGKCKYLEICNGNLRARAEAVSGDTWADDPACYLTDEEIGVAR